MSLVLGSSSYETPNSPDHSLQTALDDFKASLTPAQRQKLVGISSVQDAQAVLTFTAQLDREVQLKKGSGVATRLCSVLQCVQSFSTVIDTFVSSNPTIAALVWGSIKVAMLIAVNYTSYFEALSNLFMAFSVDCPRFADYQALFPESVRLQAALYEFHAGIILCCKHALEAIQRPWQKQLFRAFTQSFEQEFSPDLANIRRLGKEVKEQIRFAKTEADHRDHYLQQKEREAATKQRSMIQKLIPKTEKELKTIKRHQLQQSRRQTRLERQRLLELLSSHDYLAPFKEACRKRHAGTAEWITSTSEFTRWFHGTGSALFWCSVGSGKTVLCANVIVHILANQGSEDRATFFFLQHDFPESLKAETLIRSVIKQSIDVNTLTQDIEDELRSLDNKQFVPLEDWVNLLRRRTQDFGIFFVVIDGLDEYDMSERRDLLDAISTLCVADSSLRIFVASRDSVHLDLRHRFTSFEHVTMTSDHQAADIRLYIEATLQERKIRGELVCGDPDLLHEINNILSRRADGMFLWAAFLISEVCIASCDDDIRHCLGNLPRNLEETFARALSRILQRGSEKNAQRTFRWLVAAKRPLTLNELGDAMSTSIGQPYSNPGKRIHDMDRIILWCENLVQITEEEPRLVHFAHRTIRDFFVVASMPAHLTRFHIDPAEADHLAGEICVTYIHMNDFKTTVAQRARPLYFDPAALTSTALTQGSRSPRLARSMANAAVKLANPRSKLETDVTLAGYDRVNSDQSLDILQQSHPFLAYATKYWIFHTRSFQEGKSHTWYLWHQIITNGHGLAQIPWPEQGYPSRWLAMLTWSQETSHIALLRYALGVVEPSYEISEMMQESAWNNDIEIVEAFLEAEKHVRSYLDIDKALEKASEGGHLQMVERLLDAGVRLERYINGQAALVAASENGHLQIVERLLRAQSNVNPLHYRSGLALVEASRGGHVRIVECLLGAGAEVNHLERGSTHWAALAAASKAGHVEVVERLLQAGADVNQIRHHWTALMFATAEGHVQIVERLLEAGADVNTKGRTTALKKASYHGHLQIVEQLLSAGAQVDLDDDEDNPRSQSALDAAVEGDHYDVVKTLLANGAKVNGHMNSKTTPLDLALTVRPHDGRVGDLLKRAGGKYARDLGR